MQTKKSVFQIAKNAVIESWLGLLALVLFVTFGLGNHPVAAGAALIVAAVLAMNGLARTENLLTEQGPSVWKEHPSLRWLHHVTSEGELAGILVGFIALVLYGFTNGHLPHLPIYGMATIIGVLSAARLATRSMNEIMSLLERVGGRGFAIAVGSLLSALTGPAASLYMAEYVKTRSKEKDRPKVATLLAATIGSGNGLLPFVAPPVLIVWGTLQQQFGWGIGRLLLMAGLVCTAHVVVCTKIMLKYLQAPTEIQRAPLSAQRFLPLLPLVALVTLHILTTDNPLVLGADLAIGLTNLILAKREYRGAEEDRREEAHAAAWQPLILGILLVALEVIGLWATPTIASIAGLIPSAMPLFALAVTLFFVTAIVSHFADNALASRVFIAIPVTMITTLGQAPAEVLATAVILGALFGGFLTIPANLPNFPLARSLRVSAGQWLGSSWKIYPTALIHIIALAIMVALAR